MPSDLATDHLGGTPSYRDSVAEEIADIAVEVGIYEPAAHPVAYAAAERVRVDRPVPAQFRPERDRTATLIADHVPGVERLDGSWRDKGKENVLPLLGETFDRIGAAIAAG